MKKFIRVTLKAAGAILLVSTVNCSGENHDSVKPNIILIMTDDQGWGQTGYYNHPVLKTPNLDAMAENGLRFDRFYAGGPVCSPTRATVLTGRAHDRTGVPEHGYALQIHEKTIAPALKSAGYATSHFGKWHLNGLRGPGVPIFGNDSHSPGKFGFDKWLSVTNFFDMNPILSDNGDFKEFTGNSSEVIVNEALKFIGSKVKEETPFFTVIWDGSPHAPWVASEADRAPFSMLDEPSQHHYGELVAFDRSLGILRKGLRDMGIADNTILWYCSDNGGLPNVKPTSVGDLRGFKGSVWEGGIRVPAIIEWPAVINKQISVYPASTLDIFPTLVDILGLPDTVLLNPSDGISLKPLFTKSLDRREMPIPFRFQNQGALIDNNYKLVSTDIKNLQFELYDLEEDPSESENIAEINPEVFNRMKAAYLEWSVSVDASVSGEDYPDGELDGDHPEPHFWMIDTRYEPYLEEWVKRPEYEIRIKRGR
jgi:arylsulfatase A-like enzyme